MLEGRRFLPSTEGSALLSALQSQLHELEGDGSLGRRVLAAQQLAALLAEAREPDYDGLCRLFQGRGVPSLLVALIGICGEDHTTIRNCILATLSTLSAVFTSNELVSDVRVWAMLMRMLYQVVLIAIPAIPARPRQTKIVLA